MHLRHPDLAASATATRGDLLPAPAAEATVAALVSTDILAAGFLSPSSTSLNMASSSSALSSATSTTFTFTTRPPPRSLSSLISLLILSISLTACPAFLLSFPSFLPPMTPAPQQYAHFQSSGGSLCSLGRAHCTWKTRLHVAQQRSSPGWLHTSQRSLCWSKKSCSFIIVFGCGLVVEGEVFNGLEGVVWDVVVSLFLRGRPGPFRLGGADVDAAADAAEVAFG
mmetsp:Transcript_25551/g.54957  ORF Transcript_25551/g.54957 Transcript_25551/m.54957 type:complete len:225 (-) Transcript_25551:808-1482(-)